LHERRELSHLFPQLLEDGSIPSLIAQVGSLAAFVGIFCADLVETNRLEVFSLE
jgi:hypothetical protein